MSISRISDSLARSQGFTLLEVLVVVVIVGILAGTVVLSFVGSDREQNLKTEAQRLALTLELARDEALQRNRAWGLIADPEGYVFVRYDDEGKRWVSIERKPFAARTLPEQLSLHNRNPAGIKQITDQLGQQEAGENKPDIIIFSDGEVTPFELVLTPAWESSPWKISSDGLSRTKAERT